MELVRRDIGIQPYRSPLQKSKAPKRNANVVGPRSLGDRQGVFKEVQIEEARIDFEAVWHGLIPKVETSVFV
jgi:hypothetical protein